MTTVSGVDKDLSDPAAWGEAMAWGGRRGRHTQYKNLLWVLSDWIPFF